MGDRTNIHKSNDNVESNKGPAEKPGGFGLIPGIHIPFVDNALAQRANESNAFTGIRPKADPAIVDAIKEGDKMASLLLEGKFELLQNEKDKLPHNEKDKSGNHIRDVISDEFKDKVADVYFNVLQMPDGNERQTALRNIALRIHEAVKDGLINPGAEQDINNRVGQKCQEFAQKQQNQANQDYQNQPAFNPGVPTDHPLSDAEVQKLSKWLLGLGLLA